MNPLLLRLAPVACLLLLSAEPAWWLVGTWHLPGYEGSGAWAALFALVLLCWSVASPVDQHAGAAQPGDQVTLWLWLCVSLLLRTGGAIAGINLLGALVLPLDLYLLARALRVGVRERPLAPLWLAAVGFFALPLEPLVQRIFGFPLQQLSAAASCELLGLGLPELLCDGVRLQLGARELLVDLPCSGARIASQLGLLGAALCALKRPRWPGALAFCLGALGVAVAANVLRITVIALGLVYQAHLPIDVLDPVAHEAIGLVALALAAVALLALAGWLRPALIAQTTASRAEIWMSRLGLRRGPGVALWYWVPLLAGALVLPWLGEDAGRGVLPTAQRLPAPSYLAGYLRQPQPLSTLEAAYFDRYGAQGSRAGYGPFGLYLMQTAAPLRHLHAPEICLRGLGHQVRFLGTRYTPVPASVYDVRASDERRYQVMVSYLSSDGRVVPSIAEAVWRWFTNPAQRWTMIQRVLPLSPAGTPISHADRFEVAVSRAFNLAPAVPAPLALPLESL
ncbi:MAG: exosortase T [Pseudomonadota bacterium]